MSEDVRPLARAELKPALYPPADRLYPGQTLNPGEALTSASGVFHLRNKDGCLLLGKEGSYEVKRVCSLNGHTQEAAQALLTWNGDLIGRRLSLEPGEADWRSRLNGGETAKTAGRHYLELQNDGSLMPYSEDGRLLWHHRSLNGDTLKAVKAHWLPTSEKHRLTGRVSLKETGSSQFKITRIMRRCSGSLAPRRLPTASSARCF